MEIDGLKDFCRSEGQRAVLVALKEHTTWRAAAKAMGLPENTLRCRYDRIRKNAIRRGWSPEHGYTKPQPPGFGVSGVSTQYDAEGNIRSQWVKSSADKAQLLESYEYAAERLAELVLGKADPVPSPQVAAPDLMCALLLGDPHVGMLSWQPETGENWDLEIAERVLVGAVEKAVALAPPAETCLIVNLGDFYHSDNAQNRTARSGHSLDVDGRWAKVLAAGEKIMVRIINACLKKFKRVILDNVQGNHDDHSAYFLSRTLNAYFHREPRVEVCLSPALHHFWEHGKCLIGTHHGHSTKFAMLPAVMAASKSEAWGKSEHRRWYCGHVHHDSVKEFPGVIVETVNTLAARDAYAAGAGYLSGRDLKIDTWHKEHGLVNRNQVGLSMIEGA